MTAVPLRIVRSRTPAPACAWLVPGGDAARWLDAIAALGLPAQDLRLFVVPAPGDDSSARALVVVPSEEPPTSPASGRTLPLARRGARLLIPVDGRLWPPVEDAELDAALPRGLHLFHPVHEMVSFDDADALRVSDLVVPRARRDARWDAAHPGIRQPVLRGVRAEQLATADAVLASGKGNTSSKPFETLPPAPAEKREPPSKSVGDWFAKLLLRLTKNAPRTASAPTWVNHAEDWANRRLRADIEAQRAREIERLLHLLRNDPDLGLQFALPIAGILTRGVAPPTGWLPARRTDFDFRALGGGAPGDAWSLAPEKTRDLTTLYRQQAERAIRLGQHRRAAYVLANLLGDLRGAATALEAGRQWREAAALYRERLKDPAAAASCLERGGLLTEAIALYLEVGDRLHAAKLLDRVGRRADAERLWRDVVAERRAAGDRVGAAALLAGELRAPDEALQVLDDGWPRGGQPDSRLRAALELLGRLGRSEDARRWVRRAREVTATPVGPIVGVLSHAAVLHPDSPCRADAADAVRVLVGSELSDGQTIAPALLESLVGTDRADRLLRRDASRFGVTRGRRAKPVSRSASAYEIAGEFGLPNLLVESLTVVPTHDGVLVCGTSTTGPGIELHAVAWDGRQRAPRLRWELIGPRKHGPILRVDAFSRRIVIGYAFGGPRLYHQELVETVGRAWNVQTPAWLPDGLRGMCAGAALSTWTLVDLAGGPGLLATCRGQSGVDLRSALIHGDVGPGVTPVVHVAGALFLAVPQLIRVGAKGVVAELPASSPVRALATAPRHLGSSLLATGEAGCELWTRLSDLAPTSFKFADDSDSPLACFLGDGRIVVLDGDRVRVFRRDGDRLRCVLDQEWTRDRSWIAAFPGPHEREIAVVTTSSPGSADARLSRLRFPVAV